MKKVFAWLLIAVLTLTGIPGLGDSRVNAAEKSQTEKIQEIEGYINQVESMNPARYTKDTWSSLYNFTMGDPKLIVDMAKNDPSVLTEAAYNFVVSQMKAQFANLVELTGMSMIDVLLKEVDGLNATDYTTDSWNSLNETVTMVKENYSVLPQALADQPAIIQLLKDGISELKKVSDSGNTSPGDGQTNPQPPKQTGKEKVQAALAEIDQLNAEDYTIYSWTALQTNIEQFRDEAIFDDPRFELQVDVLLAFIKGCRDDLVDITKDYEPTELKDGKYMIPLVALDSYVSKPFEADEYRKRGFVQNTAFVEVKDGKATATVRIGGSDLTKALSVLKHSAYKSAKRGTPPKIGTKNIVSEFTNKKELQNKGYLLNENDEYWRDDVDIQVEKNTFFKDVTFSLENISESVYVSALLDNQDNVPDRDAFLFFDSSKAVRLPDSLEDGNYTWGFDLSNYGSSQDKDTAALTDYLSTNLKQELSGFLEKDVQTEIKDGKIKATFTWKDKEIPRGVYKLTQNTLTRYMLLHSEYFTDYQQLSQGKTFTLEFPADYKALTFGSQLLVDKRVNLEQKTPKDYYYAAVFLRADDAQQVKLSDTSTGVTYLTDTHNVGKDSVLKAPAVQKGDEKYQTVSEKYDTVVRKWSAWNLSIEDNNGSQINVPNNGELRFPIPEGYDKQNLNVAYQTQKGAFEIVSGEVQGNEYVVHTRGTGLFILYENKVYTDGSKLRDGTYQVEVATWKMKDDEESMSNQAINGRAKIVVKNGVKTLYLNLGAAHILGTEGYMAKMWYYDTDKIDDLGDPVGNLIPVTVSQYYRNQDGSLMIDQFNYETSKYYPKEVYFTLPSDKSELSVRFNVPVMDGFANGKDNSQDARLRIDYGGAVKISDETPDQPEPDKLPQGNADKSELKAKLDQVAELLKKESLYTASSVKQLKEVVSRAEEKYNAPEAVQPEITKLAEELSKAMSELVLSETSSLDYKNLPDGTYSVSVQMIKTNKQEFSMSNEAIGRLVKLTVENGKYYITVNFKGLKINNYFGYLSNLNSYKDGYTYNNGKITGELEPAQVLSVQKDENGNLIVDDYNDKDHPYPLALKFELVPTALNDQDGFAALQVFVPLMDSISKGSGTQDVFMKLDWNTLKVAKDSDFIPEKPEQQSPEVNQEDTSTGVKIQADKGVLPEGTVLYSHQITQGETYDKAAHALEDVGGKFVLFDISLLLNGQNIQPDGVVKLSVPIPEGYDQSKLAIYRINDDGSKTLVQGEVENNNYVFYVNHFSVYALVEKGSAAPSTSDSDIKISQGSDQSVHTGDQTPVAFWIGSVMSAVLLMGVGVVLGKRRKNKE